MLLVQVTSALSELGSKGTKHVLNSALADDIDNTIEGAWLRAIIVTWLSDKLDEVAEHFVLVVDIAIGDFALQASGLQLVLTLLAFLEIDSAHVDLVHVSGVLSPLATQVLLVHREQSTVLGDFNLDLGILLALWVQ